MLCTTEFLLLAVMSFDRYMAICKPLHYVSITNSQACSLLVITAWIGVAVLRLLVEHQLKTKWNRIIES